MQQLISNVLPLAGTLLVAILVFGFVIFFHELGHFLTAKLSGIRVLEFAIGMGPTLFSRERGGTKYAIRLLPVGGFVMMEGEDEESDSMDSFSRCAGRKPPACDGSRRIYELCAGLSGSDCCRRDAGQHHEPDGRGILSGCHDAAVRAAGGRYDHCGQRAAVFYRR